jgi:hypothetical protein
MNKYVLAAFVTAVLLSATAAAADSITILEDQRKTQALANVTVDIGRQGDALTSNVRTESAVVTATLTSSIADPAHLSAVGVGDISWSIPFGASTHVADSTFGVRFRLTSPFAYAFNGSVMQSHLPDELPGSLGANAFGQLIALSGFVHAVFAIETPRDLHGAVTRTFTGLLDPGDYQLVAKASTATGGMVSPAGSGVEHAEFAFDFDLTPAGSSGSPSPTPEPSSLLLLASGCASVVGIRRRSKHRGQ